MLTAGSNLEALNDAENQSSGGSGGGGVGSTSGGVPITRLYPCADPVHHSVPDAGALGTSTTANQSGIPQDPGPI